MPIKVACSCGQSFAAPDHLAGRAVKCPKCGQPLKIPAAGPQQPAASAPAAGGSMADFLAEEGLAASAGSGTKCPSCSTPMPAHGFICTNCGFNVQTGRKMQIEDPTLDTAKRDAEAMLRKASRELRETPQEFSASDLGSGAGAYIAAAVILLATILLLGMGAGFMYIFEEYLFDEGGGGIGAGGMTILIGAIFGSIGGIWLLVIAFMENVMKGLFCLICGPYFLYFAFTKAGEQKLPFALYLLGLIMQIAGSVMMGLSE